MMERELASICPRQHHKQTLNPMIRAALILALTLMLGATASAASPPLKHVLIINSYHDGYKGSDDLVHGIRKSLRESQISLDIKVEYLDSKYFSGPEHDRWVLETLKRKYAKHDLELLLTTDDYAFEVVEKDRDSTFGRIPVVFAGTNYFDLSRIRNKPDFIGVDEAPSFADTIDLILRLHPAIKNIVAIYDDRITGQRNAKAFFSAAEQFSDRVQFSALPGLSMDELLAAGKAFKPGTVAVYFASQVDGSAGGIVSSSDALERLAANTQVPIYGGWEFNLGHGIVGGKLVNLYEHGLLAGKLGAAVLAGERSHSDQQVLPSPNRYMFDHNQLARFGISESTLPADSVIFNKPPQFIRTYTSEIVAVLIFLLAVSVTVSIRSLMLRRREFQTLAANLKAALDAAPVPMAINDRQKNITYLNEAFIKTYGYTLADLPHLEAWWEKAYPDPAYREWVSKEWGERAERSQQTGRPFEAMEVSICCQDGSRRTVRADFAPILSSRTEEAVVTLYDITEQKRIQVALQSSEYVYRTMVSSAPEGVWMIGPDRRTTEVSERMCQLIGYTREEMLGRDPVDFADEENGKVFREKARLVPNRQASVYQVGLRHRDKHDIPTEFHATTLFNPDGSVLGVLAFVTDLSERKRAEEERVRLETQLRQSQKMEALGTLAGGVAHDFNNMLAIITGNVELLRQDIGPTHPANESVEEIAKASRRSKELVQQILAFSRRQRAERKPTSLSMAVLESARMIRASMPATVAMRVDCKADAPAVLADAGQINQIVLNLCNNALHALQGQSRAGVIEVLLESHTQTEDRGELRAGRYACLTVRDNGVGMDQATRSRIFEPFFTTREVGSGTGLGLAVVHGIAQEHEAHIEVESTPGDGTTFRIYFPAVAAADMDVVAPAPRSTQIQGCGKHILHVDDEEGLIRLMNRLLTRQGYRYSGYTDPREALAAVRADPGQFDLVVTDYNMPHMSGLEFSSAIKEIRADLPVILASGYITEELRAKAPGAGVSELINKPNTADDLCVAVARLANQQGQRESSTGSPAYQ